MYRKHFLRITVAFVALTAGWTIVPAPELTISVDSPVIQTLVDVADLRPSPAAAQEWECRECYEEYFADESCVRWEWNGSTWDCTLMIPEDTYYHFFSQGGCEGNCRKCGGESYGTCHAPADYDDLDAIGQCDTHPETCSSFAALRKAVTTHLAAGSLPELIELVLADPAVSYASGQILIAAQCSEEPSGPPVRVALQSPDARVVHDALRRSGSGD